MKVRVKEEFRVKIQDYLFFLEYLNSFKNNFRERSFILGSESLYWKTI
jgi:hypothetical protein